VLAIVVSRADSASVNVGERLLELADWTEHEDTDTPESDGGGTYHRLEDGNGSGDAPVELRTFEALHLHLERPADAFSETPDLLVFASRHAGDTDALLTAHTTGNFGPAEFGGEDYALAEAAPNALARIREAFAEHAPAGYEVGLECTHHGPTDVGCPSLFAELGSDEAQWEDEAGAEAVARAILDLRGVDPRRERSLVGLGGGHYVHRFERLVVETDWAVGHVASDWALGDVGDPREHPAVFREAFEASEATRALLDADADTDATREFVADLGYDVVSETWLRETSGIPLELVERVEATFGPVARGTRFGRRAASTEPDTFVEAALPERLLEECVGIDRDRARAAVAERTVAFETAESGTVPTGAVLLGASDDRGAILDALLPLLESRYDEVARNADTVIVRTREFDPEKAATLGVSEGPAFGKLASGQAVEVGGRTIDPEAVTSVREETFEL
jgi:D-aminoacyl-tRNA deacylase